MKIKILGTRAHIDEWKPRHRKHSGVLIDDIILLDLGEEEFLKYNPEIILITHLHPDHAFFIQDEVKLKVDCPVFLPESSNLVAGAEIIKDPIQWKKYKISPVPTLHSKYVKSQGYIVEKDNRRVLYTGDIVWIEKKHMEELPFCDAIITEASYIRKGGLIFHDKETGKIYGHNGIPDLIKIFESHTSKIIFVHQGSWFMKDIKLAKRKIKDLEKKEKELIIAYDGYEFNIF